MELAGRALQKVNRSRSANKVSELVKPSGCVLPTWMHWPEPPSAPPTPTVAHSGCPAPALWSGHPTHRSVNTASIQIKPKGVLKSNKELPLTPPWALHTSFPGG